MQLGLKGHHNQQVIQVRKSRHGAKSLEAMVQVLLALLLPLSLLPLHLVFVCELSAHLDSGNITAYDDDFDLLLWWCDHKLTFPILSIMARDIMSVPVSTVSSESCFSLTGRIIEERRGRLLPENVEMLALIKDWELGETRQQHAVDNPELEEAFENLYLGDEEGSTVGT